MAQWHTVPRLSGEGFSGVEVDGYRRRVERAAGRAGALVRAAGGAAGEVLEATTLGRVATAQRPRVVIAVDRTGRERRQLIGEGWRRFPVPALGAGVRDGVLLGVD